MMTDPTQKRRFARTRDGTRDATGPKSELVRQLRDLGVRSGDMVMPHVSLRAVGPLADGPQTLVDALIEAVGPTGNILAFVSWRDSPYEQTLGHDAPPAAIAQSWPAFDPRPCARLPRLWRDQRIYPNLSGVSAQRPSRRIDGGDRGPMRRGWWRRTRWAPLMAPARRSRVFSPTQEKSLSIGAGPDAVTALHYAEAVARIEGKRRVTYSMPLLREGKRVWVTTSDWDSNGILDEYAAPDGPDAVERIARDYLARTRGCARPGRRRAIPG